MRPARKGQIEDWEFTSTCTNPEIQRLSVRTPVDNAPFCRGVTKTPEAARTDTDRITPPEANNNKTNVVCAGGSFPQRSRGWDGERMTTRGIEGYLDEMSSILGQIDSDQVQRLVDVLCEAWTNNATVFICGNGGSASTASHMATDLSKQTAVAGRRELKSIALTDNVGSFTAWANDAGFDEAFARQIENLGADGDILVCFSCSGVSTNIVRAMDEARRRQMAVLAIGGFGGG